MKTYLLPIALLCAAVALPAGAADMHHRHTEHIVEGYLIGGVGASVVGRRVSGEVGITPAYLQWQGGVGLTFPMNPHACLGLGGVGLELVMGPALALGAGRATEVQVRPGLVLEFSGDFPLQLLLRGSAILRPADESGAAAALMVGWHARPLAFRLGVTYERYSDSIDTFSGLRFEVLWTGVDPR